MSHPAQVLIPALLLTDLGQTIQPPSSQLPHFQHKVAVRLHQDGVYGAWRALLGPGVCLRGVGGIARGWRVQVSFLPSRE